MIDIFLNGVIITDQVISHEIDGNSIKVSLRYNDFLRKTNASREIMRNCINGGPSILSIGEEDYTVTEICVDYISPMETKMVIEATGPLVKFKRSM